MTPREIIAQAPFCLKPFSVKVDGFNAAFYAARTRQQAIARCWRDYQSCRDIAFRDFLKIVRASKTVAPPGFGEPITVSGFPAFRVSGEPGVNNYVKFVRPGSDRIVYSHPNDVEPVRALSQEAKP